MTPERWAEVTRVFHEALERDTPARAAYLAETCATDTQLRSDVDSLLGAHEDAGRFMSGPELVSATAGPTVSMATFARPGSRGEGALAPGRRVGPYAVLRRLGSGGMGEVFLARHLALGRMAALKVMHGDRDPDFQARLQSEGKAVARLQHPCIATFHEFLESSDVTVLAMEYVPGPTLRKRLQEGPLTPEEAVAVTGCLLEGLAHAHAAGILHRDIKPENVVLTGLGSAKLLDFGIALHVLAPDEVGFGDTVTRQTGLGGLVGTLGYMSPEQVRGEGVSARSDIFAVGAVLYEMLSDRPAFPGATPAARLAAVLSRDPDPLSEGTAPRGLAGVVARALDREPSRRFPSARAFLRQLYDAASSRATAVLPPTLAVVDLENLSGDPALNWIGSGVAEGLAADLARVHGLAVVPREAMMRVRVALLSREAAGDTQDVGIALGCRWVLSGRFEKSDQRLRLAFTLREVRSGRVLVEDTLEADLDRVLELKDRTALACAKALDLQPAEIRAGREHPSAFEAYARGSRMRARLEKGSLEQAQELFEEAIRFDPTYAPALAGLAATHCLRFTFTTDPRDLDRGLEHAARALLSDPQNGEAYIWEGYALSNQGRYQEALEAFSRAEELNPLSHYPPYFSATTFRGLGRRREGLKALQRAVGLNREAGVAWLYLGWTQVCFGLFGEASYSLARARELEGQPDSMPGVGGYLGENARRAGAFEAARKACLEGLESVERSDHMFRDSLRGFALCALARTALEQGDAAAAQGAFSQALAQLRARPRALGGGHLAVQALAGLARAGQPSHLDEALQLFDSRGGFDFHYFHGCHDDATLFELARAAFVIGRPGEGDDLLARARAAGALEPFSTARPGQG